MKALANAPFAWLLRREYWESRRGFLWAQVAAIGVILIVTLFGIIAGEFVQFHGSGNFGMEGVNLGAMLDRATRNDAAALAKGLDVTLLLFVGLSAVVLFFVVFFYLLGALYDDRRDRSILFWKSLPVSDTSTVLSKIVAAVIVAPVIAMVVALAGYVAMQIVISAWFLVHGINPFVLLWAHADPFLLWLRLLTMLLVNAVWALPTVGWLLLWSAAVRSKPFLWAVMVPIIAGVLNGWIGLLGLPHVGTEFLWVDVIGRALLSVMPAGWIAPNAATLSSSGINFVDAGQMGAISYASMAHAFALPQMWLGALAGIALIALAIWFRHWRSET